MKTKNTARSLTIISMILMLICFISTTFAWYTVYEVNKGTIKVEVETQVDEGIVLAFTPFSELEGILRPAQMKPGVINNHLVKNDDGTYESGLLEKLGIPVGNKVIAKTYDILDNNNNFLHTGYAVDANNFGNLVPDSEYLEYPATTIMRQFNLSVGSATETTKNAVFSIDIQYLDGSGKFIDLKQKDAFAINFMMVSKQLTNQQLSSISTDRYDSDNHKAKTFKTFSELMYENKDDEELKLYIGTLDDGNYTITGSEKYNFENREKYKIYPKINDAKDGNFTLDFRINNIQVEVNHYLIITIYYNLPDELIDGDLLITKEIVLNIHYSLETVVG